MEEMIIRIPVNGPVTIEVEGVSGPRCAEISKSLEEKLGKVTKTTEKAEYYEHAHNLDIQRG